MADIVLVNPPWTRMLFSADDPLYAKARNETSVSPPFGLALLATILSKQGFEVRPLDLYGYGPSEALAAIIRERPRLVGVCCFTDQRASAFSLISKLRANLPHAKIVMGGPHASVLGRQIIATCDVDMILPGEAEHDIVAAVAHFLSKKGHPPPLRSLIRQGTRICGTDRPVRISDLDTLPAPDYSDFDLSRYAKQDWLEGIVIDGKHAPDMTVAAVVGKRGCPYGCSFCSVESLSGRQVRKRSPGHVVEELLHLKKEGFDFVNFEDDIFTVDRRWTLELCSRMVDARVGLTWSCATRTDAVDRETLCAMADSGCLYVSYGVESLARASLQDYDKALSVEKQVAACSLTHECGLGVELLLIVGGEHETDETVDTTQKVLEEIEPEFIDVSILTIYPKTPLYAAAVKEGFISDEYWLSARPAPYDTRRHSHDALERWWTQLTSTCKRPFVHRSRGRSINHSGRH